MLSQIRERLLAAAEEDPAVTGAALIGSHAAGHDDRWSDIDLAVAVRGPLPETLQRWTTWVAEEFGLLHHWDLPSGESIYRLFLLPGLIEIDIGFMPEASFGPRGPNWRLVFGQPQPLRPVVPPEAGFLIGMAWHDTLAAHKYLKRGKVWQAEQWITSLRRQVLALACLRLGHPWAYARGAHLLPVAVSAALEQALVRSLDEPELRRALEAATNGFLAELHLTDPALAARVTPMFHELLFAGAN